LHQSAGDIDRGIRGRIVDQGRHELQDRYAGERTRTRRAVHAAPLAQAGRLRQDAPRSATLPARSMNEARLTSIVVESPAPARTIAARTREGKSPGLFWLGGFKSDMKGTKADALDRWAAEHGRACVRFDYSGHGESGGDFRE